MIARHDRTGERTDDDQPLPVAVIGRPAPPLRDEPRPSGGGSGERLRPVWPTAGTRQNAHSLVSARSCGGLSLRQMSVSLYAGFSGGSRLTKR
jgi:hypothetical protein